MSHAAIVVARVRAAGRGRHRPRHGADQDRPAAARGRHRPGGDDPRRAREAHPPRSPICAPPTSALFGGKSASLGELIAADIPVPPGFAASSAAGATTLEEIAAAYGALGEPAGGGALERGRRGQRRGDVRRPAGDVPVGARSRRRVRARCATAGRASTAPRRSPTARGWAAGAAGDGRDGAADGRRRGVRRDVHLQPGQRRPEHGRDQRELGARARRRGRRGDARRVPREQGHAARCCTAAIGPKQIEYAARGERSDVPAERREVACLDDAAAGRAGRRGARGSSATSAPIRTSSGRSRATASCSCSSRGRSRSSASARGGRRRVGDGPRDGHLRVRQDDG